MKLRPRTFHSASELLDDTCVDLPVPVPRLVLPETCDAAESAQKDASGVVTEITPHLREHPIEDDPLLDDPLSTSGATWLY